MRFAAKGERAAGGAGFCGGPEVYCEQWCDSSYGTNGELQMEKERIWRDCFLSRMRGMEEMASEVLS